MKRDTLYYNLSTLNLMPHALVQFILRVFRWMHIDVYAILKNRAERRMWRQTLPKVRPNLNVCLEWYLPCRE